MTEQEVLKILGEVGAVISKSHIVYTSGKHGATYVNKDAIYPRTKIVSRLCRALGERFLRHNPDVVIAPALGGIILSQWVAHHLSELCDREILGVYAEKEGHGKSFIIQRGYDQLMAGKRVLVVEDVLTTGGSAKKVAEASQMAGGQVIGLGALCNRGGVAAGDVGVPELIALLTISLEAWDPLNCPLCEKGIPVNTNVGKGREFLSGKK